MPMSHAENTYDFEIAEDDPHYEEISDYSLEMLWVYTYGDGGVLQFKNIKGIKNYFDSVTIETQELIPIGFKNTLLNRETK